MKNKKKPEVRGPQRKALLIGIIYYQAHEYDPDTTEMHQSYDKVMAMKDILLNHHHFEQDSIKILSNWG